MQALWLVGGRQHDADELFWKVLGLQRAGPVLIPQETLAAAYSREMGIRDGAPSTGFVGELCISDASFSIPAQPFQDIRVLPGVGPPAEWRRPLRWPNFELS